MKISTLFAIAGIALSSLAAASAAHADELVVNGGFEAGDFTGWTQTGNTGFTDVNNSVVAGGDFAAEFGPVGSVGGITQTLTTVAGQLYNIHFDLQNNGGAPNSFSATFGGVTLLTQTDAPGFDYTPFDFTILANSTTSDLTFGFQQNPSFYHLDNVSVTGVTGAVPEPATWATMIIGLGMVGGLMRRRRRLGPVAA